jgi:hypothetical protein
LEEYTDTFPAAAAKCNTNSEEMISEPELWLLLGKLFFFMFCSKKQMHREEKGGTLKLIVVKSCNCHKTRMLKKWVLLLLLSLLPDAASTTPEKPSTTKIIPSACMQLTHSSKQRKTAQASA